MSTITSFSYTNAYEPFTKECITVDSPSISTAIYHRCVREKQRLRQTPYSVHEQFCRAIILRCTSALPTQPKNPDYFDPKETFIQKETYLYVYGFRPYILLELKDQFSAWEYSQSSSLARLVNLLHSQDVSVVDAKLDYKRPYMHAAGGGLYMIKLYFGTSNAPQITRLRKILQGGNFDLSSRFKNTLHNSSISTYQLFYIANRAAVHGEIKVTGPVNEKQLKKNDQYLVASTFYKNVKFMNDEELHISEEYASVLTNLLRSRYAIIIDKVADTSIADLFRSRLLHVTVGYGSQCEWRQFKQQSLYPMFLNGKGSLVFEEISTSFLNGIRKLPNYSCTYNITNQEMMKAVAELCRFYANIRLECKKMWLELGSNLITETQKRTREQRLLLHTNALRHAYLDIETSYIPHCTNEELFEVNIITILLCDHAHRVPLEALAFVLIADERKDGGEKTARATSLSKKNILDLACVNLERLDLEDRFHIHYFMKERDLLASCIDYIRAKKIHVLGYFNGTKFDLPFIVARMSYLKMRDYVTITNWTEHRPEHRPRIMSLSLTDRRDQGIIRYRHKMPTKNHKAYGVEIYSQTIEAMRDQRVAENNDNENVYYDDDVENYDYDFDFIPSTSVKNIDTLEAEGIPHEDCNPTSEMSGAMLAARQIKSISMHNLALLDVMLNIDANRGCRLDVASKLWLGVDKLADTRTSYENLTNTWRFGTTLDLEVMVAYCLRDTLLTALIARKKKISLFYMGVSTWAFMNFRQLFLNQMLSQTISTQCSFSVRRGIVPPDSTYIKEERPLWVPGYNFTPERDLEKLTVLAGRTVENCGYFDKPIVTTDFSSQYPSIIRSYNICASSWLTKQQALSLPNDAYYCTTIHNVKPMVEHACEKYGLTCGGGVDGTTNPRTCKYDVNYSRVEGKIYIANSTYFRGLMSESLEMLSAVRINFQKLMKSANTEVERDLYDALQASVKIQMNSFYGVSLRLYPLVGTLITQLGRQQIEKIAEKGKCEGFFTVNGDTDSTFLLDKEICSGPPNMGRLSCMSLKLCGHLKAPISTIFSKMMEKYENFCNEANINLHPPPCKIQLEKVFLFHVMLEKKHYMGEKVLPGSLALLSHYAGISGFKRDSTIIKKASQFVPGKLTGNRDIDGLVKFVIHLYDAVSMRLRAYSIAQIEVDQICDEIDLDIENYITQNIPPETSDNTVLYIPPWKKNVSVTEIRRAADISRKARAKMMDFDAANKEQAIQLDHMNGEDPFPFDWLLSSEKVGDIDHPITPATKAAVRQCKRNGLPRHKSPLFVNLARNHEVQISTPIIKFLEVLLRAPESNDEKQRREMFEKVEMGSKAWSSEQKRRETKLARDAVNKAKLTKLSITTMPAHLIVPASDRAVFSERERAEIYQVIKHIKKRDKIIDLERRSSFKELMLNKPKAPTDSEISRLRMFITNQPAATYAPLWWYDSQYCETKLDNLDQWFSLPHEESACDLWEMYVNTRMARRYIHVKCGIKLSIIASSHFICGSTKFDCDDSSWNSKNVHNISHDDCENSKIFSMDMGDRYAMQTRSTPFIVTSICGTKRYLVNKDSYCPNRANRFSFSVHLAQLLNMSAAFMQDAKGMNVIISFEPIINTCDVRVRILSSKVEFLLKNVEILRDDKRKVYNWFWNDPPLFILRYKLDSILSRLRMEREERLKIIEIRFDNEILIIQRAVDAVNYRVPYYYSPEEVPLMNIPELSDGNTASPKRNDITKPKRHKSHEKRVHPYIDVRPKKQTKLISFFSLEALNK